MIGVEFNQAIYFLTNQCMVGVDLVASFFELLYSIRLRQGGEDKICWIPSNKWSLK
jgi:hypothetical protein